MFGGAAKRAKEVQHARDEEFAKGWRERERERERDLEREKLVESRKGQGSQECGRMECVCV